MVMKITNEVIDAFLVLAGMAIVYLAALSRASLAPDHLSPLLGLLPPLHIPQLHLSIAQAHQHILQEFPLPLLPDHIAI